MIQFNLLPDVKIKYIKARRQKRMVILAALVTGGASLGVLVVTMGYVYIVQGAQITGLNKKIASSISSISTKNSQVDDINKVLTVQNQLISLDTLHTAKPITSRVFDYLTKLTPANVTISKIQITNSDTKTISMTGSTDTLESINRFVDTLKFTTFNNGTEGSEDKQIFTDVVLTSFGRDKAGASYAVTFAYDPIIFESSSKLEGLVVPNKITTRSELGRPVLQTETEKANNAPDQAGSK